MRASPLILGALLLVAPACRDHSSPDEATKADQIASPDGSLDTSEPDVEAHDAQATEDLPGGDGLPGVDVSPPSPKPLPPLSNPLIFEPGSEDAAPRVQTAVALGEENDVAVVWTGANEDSSLGIRFTRHGLDGGVRTPAYPLSTATQGIQNEPSVCALAEGGFVVAWSRDTQSLGPDGENLEIRFRIVGADGLPLQESDTRVLSDVPGNHWLAEVACSPKGGFVVVGVRPDTDGVTFGVFAWRYTHAGEPDGSAVALNLTPEGTQTVPDVAVNADGAVAAIWNDATQMESGQSLERVLLRWLPPAPDEPGDIVEIAGAPGSPASFGQVASTAFSTEVRVVAMLSDGAMGLWAVTDTGSSTSLNLPHGDAMTNPALASLQPGAYAFAFQQGAGAEASLRVALLSPDGGMLGSAVVESGPQLPYPLSLDGDEGILVLGWTTKDAEGAYVTRVAVFKSPE